MKFYFTFGSDAHFPYPGRYLIVVAEDLRSAATKFREKYPDRTPNTLNCAFVYSQTEWNKVLPAMRLQKPAEVIQ